MTKNRRTKSTSMAEMFISPTIQQMLSKNLNKKSKYPSLLSYSSKTREDAKKVSININNNFNANSININILHRESSSSKKEPHSVPDKPAKQQLKGKKTSDQGNAKRDLGNSSKPSVTSGAKSSRDRSRMTTGEWRKRAERRRACRIWESFQDAILSGLL